MISDKSLEKIVKQMLCKQLRQEGSDNWESICIPSDVLTQHNFLF